MAPASNGPIPPLETLSMNPIRTEVAPNVAARATARRAALALALVVGGMAASSLLSACNTVEGVGKDTQAVGEGLENAAEGAKN
jgi:predicted small secreted protein